MNYIQKLAVGAIKQFKTISHVDLYVEDGHHRLRGNDDISVYVEDGTVEVYPGGFIFPISEIQSAHISAYVKDSLEVRFVTDNGDEVHFIGLPR